MTPGPSREAPADSPAPTPIPISKARNRRTEILDAALEIFVRHGYLGTTMEAIGEAVGMRAPSLYKHVRSKQELLVELMSRSITEVHAALDAATGSTSAPVLRLRRAMEAHVRYHAEHCLDALLGANELSNLEPGPFLERILAERDRYEAAFVEVVECGVAAGVFTVEHPKTTARALLDMGSGVSVWFRRDGELSVDALVYHYSDLAVRLVGADDAGAGSTNPGRIT
ncbi:MAG: TetR/AcrR family transcriptional regulator [Acidimicrobiales bacterium]